MLAPDGTELSPSLVVLAFVSEFTPMWWCLWSQCLGLVGVINVLDNGVCGGEDFSQRGKKHAHKPLYTKTHTYIRKLIYIYYVTV